MTKISSDDWRDKLNEARVRLPLRRLMEQRGKGPANGNWHSFPHCPFCNHAGSASVFKTRHGDLFKCHHANCPSGTQDEKGAWDEIGFLGYELGLNRREAALVWLKEAGLEPIAPRNVSQSSFERRQVIESSVATEEPGAAEISAEARMAAIEKIRKLLRMKRGGAPAEIATAMGMAADLARKFEIDLAALVTEEYTTSSNGSFSGGDKSPPPPPPTDDSQSDETPPSRVVQAIRWFYQRISLSGQDQEKLWRKRGLLPRFTEILGLRSSDRHNLEILQEMPKHFPLAVLLDSGLWTKSDEPGSEPGPNRQYHGWGVVGKKGNDWEWGWTHPMLIPYLDARGEVVDLRPHKRTQRGQAPRLYIARPLREYRDEFARNLPQSAVVTEGEFKAMALFQTLHQSGAVAALPGITLAKILFGDIEDWLESVGLRQGQVVVGYDNEEKGDPALPGYKAEPWKRFDSEVWARILCGLLAKDGFDARVAHLPNAWRDCNGKADWDGALAFLIMRTLRTLSRDVETISPSEAWDLIQPKIRSEFLGVLRDAVLLEECWSSGIYKEEDERHIRKRQNDLSYEDELPAGRDDVLHTARRLWALCKKSQGDADRLSGRASSFLRILASAYQEVHGRYYLLKDLSKENREYWLGILQKARSREDVEVRRACEVALKGIPEKVSDFLIEPLYVLVKADGTRHRILRIHPVHGRSTPKLALPSSMYSQPSKFREWLYNTCSAAGWGTGERPLQSMAFDINHAIGLKEVNEVALWGYHEPSRMWFYGDVAYSPEGMALRADRQGIFYYDGKMYCPSEKDQEGEFYRQKAPLLHPDRPFSKDQLRELYQLYTQYLYEVIGSYAGYLAVGTILSYAAAPEIYDRYAGFSSLWVHGQPKQGKSSVSRWLTGIYGFSMDAGTSIQKMSGPGLAILLQQYGNLPVWIEEYQHPPEKWQIENLKAMYDRQPGSKKSYAELQRVVRTGGIVTGVATAENEQLRSRFCHVHVAIENRLSTTKGLPDRFDWFKDNFRNFCMIGRYLMQHRTEFARLVMEQLKHWIESKALGNCDHRARIVHGASYASFAALAAMLETHSADELVRFKQFLLGYVQNAVEETKLRSSLIQFFTDMISALKYGEFGDSPQKRGQFFRIDELNTVSSPVTSERQRELEIRYGRRWRSYVLSVTLNPVVDRLMAYKRRGGQIMELNVGDLKAQLATQPFYMQAPAKNKDRRHKMRFAGARGPQECIRIVLDNFPGMGYVKVSDDEFEASIVRPDGTIVPSSEWEDPRKGDLFVFVDFLCSESTEQRLLEE